MNLPHIKPFNSKQCISILYFKPFKTPYFCLELLSEDIGFQYGKSASFPDGSFATSSNQFDEVPASPSNGRLYKPWTFWCPKSLFEYFYLELILVQKYYIFAVSIHGQLVSHKDFRTDFSISYSQDYDIWQQYDGTFTVSYQLKFKHLYV